MKRTACPLFTAVVLCLGLTAGLSAAETVYSTAELNARKGRWAEWVDTSVKVEGRVSGISRHQFRLVHCELTFHVSDEQRRMVENARNVEVTGRIKRESGKLIFVVDRVKLLGSDLEQFAAREARLKSTKAEDWYQLAAWAEDRGKFYDDDDLAVKAHRVRGKGLQLERAALPAGSIDDRLALVEKLRQHEWDAPLQEELLHEAARLKWEQAKTDAARKEFAGWLKSSAPNSEEHLELYPRELVRRYDAHPSETFAAAKESERAQLWRILAIEVELAGILPRSKADGSNATHIADELTARVPERQDLIDQYRDQAFQWRFKSVVSAPRQEALRLADDLKSRDRAEDARQLLSTWLAAQEPRLRKDGPIGLMQLAEDYLQLVSDEAKAVRFLSEAHELDPSFEDAGARLKQLGYRWHQQNWVKGDAPAGPVPEKSSGQLAVGMTAEAVLQLLGEPNGRTRVINGKSVQEVWSFGRRGTPRLLIHLQQSVRGNSPQVTRYMTER